MNNNKHKLVIGITGASGAIYAKSLLDAVQEMQSQFEKVGIVMSENAKDVWKFELGENSFDSYPFDYYQSSDFMAPFASGSAQFNHMIICPCSMGTLGRIASGVSNDLMTRAADVILKERRKLIMVTRETPLSLIHLNNMKTVTEAGGIICPASPSFYSKSTTASEIARTVTNRVLDLCGFDQNTYRWGNK